MYIKSFEPFLEKVEELLALDPFTTRLVVKYWQKKERVIMSLRSDKKVYTHMISNKTDCKKLELVLHKVSQVLSGGVEKEDMKAAEGGKKKKKKEKY